MVNLFLLLLIHSIEFDGATSTSLANKIALNYSSLCLKQTRTDAMDVNKELCGDKLRWARREAVGCFSNVTLSNEQSTHSYSIYIEITFTQCGPQLHCNYTTAHSILINYRLIQAAPSSPTTANGMIERQGSLCQRAEFVLF